MHIFAHYVNYNGVCVFVTLMTQYIVEKIDWFLEELL
jgi:hypothetical protein